jgi:hypothetical protein
MSHAAGNHTDARFMILHFFRDADHHLGPL